MFKLSKSLNRIPNGALCQRGRAIPQRPPHIPGPEEGQRPQTSNPHPPPRDSMTVPEPTPSRWKVHT